MLFCRYTVMPLSCTYANIDGETAEVSIFSTFFYPPQQSLFFLGWDLFNKYWKSLSSLSYVYMQQNKANLICP